MSTTIGARVIPTYLSFSASGVGWPCNRRTDQWTGTRTIILKNVGKTSITGPFFVVFEDLTSGITLSNKSGIYQGNPFEIPYHGSTLTLAPGQTVTVGVTYAFTVGPITVT